jgi:aminoglycoside phosphotransferase (APT) family kinase protein
MRQWELSIGPAGIVEPLMEGLHADLVRLAPPQHRTGIVHGDFRLGNVISGMDGTIRAVLDWELATLGDPLADLGWLLAFWREPTDEPHLLPILSPVMEGPGFPSRSELSARYAATSGTSLPDLTYYVVFAMWRMAVLLENHWARHMRGTAAGFDFAYLETAGPAFAARLRRLAESSSTSPARRGGRGERS